MPEATPSGLWKFAAGESGWSGLNNQNIDLINDALVAGGLGGATFKVPAALTGTSVQDSIDDLAGTGGVVFVGPGVYPVSTTITVPNGVEVWGFGRRTLYTTGAPDRGPVFEAQTAGMTTFDLSGVSGSATTQAEKKALRNITVDGNSGLADVGIRLYDFRETLLEDVRVKNCDVALQVGDTLSTDTANQLQLNRFHAVTGVTGIDASGTNTRVFVNAWGCEVSDMSGAGIQGKFTGIWAGGQIRATDRAFDLDDSRGFLISGVNFENQATSDIRLGNTTACQQVGIENCVMATTVAGVGRDKSIDAVNGDHCWIMGGRITVHANDASSFIGVDLPSGSTGWFVGALEFNGDYTTGTRTEMNVATIANHFIWLDRYNWSGFRSATPSGSIPLQLYQTTGVPGDTTSIESQSRWKIAPDGQMQWGSGSATHDVRMERTAASTLRIDGGSGVNPILLLSATTITVGTGTPEGAVTAGKGSLFLRTDGGAGTSFYVKESGAGNTGWVAK